DARALAIQRLEQQQTRLRIASEVHARLDQVAVAVEVRGHREAAALAMVAQSQLETVARLGFQIGIGDGSVAERSDVQAYVHVGEWWRAKARRVLREQAGFRVDCVAQAE